MAHCWILPQHVTARVVTVLARIGRPRISERSVVRCVFAQAQEAEWLVFGLGNQYIYGTWVGAPCRSRSA